MRHQNVGRFKSGFIQGSPDFFHMIFGSARAAGFTAEAHTEIFHADHGIFLRELSHQRPKFGRRQAETPIPGSSTRVFWPLPIE